MARRRRSWLWGAVVGLFLLAIFGFYMLLIPNNPVTQKFRKPISDTQGRVIVGPYPVLADMHELRRHGVTTIVSLLDPKIPYERILLDKEKENAAKFQFKFFNFPMASILGHRMGDYYTRDASLAAATIDSLKSDKVYLHCYLGIHRAEVVRTLLEKNGTGTGNYTIRESERSGVARATDSAFLAYRAGHLELAIENVNKMKSPDVPALLLRGWSYYRLGQTPAAKRDFRQALNKQPDMVDADNGLAYCYLRDEQLDSAQRHFRTVLLDDVGNPEAQRGMGIVEYRQGKLQIAIERMQFAYTSDSSDKEAKYLLSQIERALAEKSR